MIAAGDKLGIKHMACIAHSLHLVVGGSVIKKSKTDDNVSKPAWAEDVAAECTEAVAEREEESALSREERGTLEYLHAFSIGEMKTFLDDVISGWHRSEVSALREIVQHFRSLAVYFRKFPKGNNQLGAIQISTAT
ncbi:hypothetical protein PC116_g15227 [Phytophthora cactorum]|uniref:Uncharacterized protein n=1 Tax=Phytophthora cactorum TaxID=29920 RepID=A0A8T0Z3A5_9STRA|nr:hypothetical protein Pcac1_g7678 [Phytophthora cactorum]KAG2823799.1 hypothetical protein PC111_g10081 [Phytophthora cactorum]KAG2829879.1 hypothetical protein PC112_g7915 [Phytophthora cactorum]KAG2856461.1 hypothetical protein PC113_g11551 [Phytophthora cactorum]KAG2910092.1 hypothetical protein PC115_g13036 [Phytophthora cactorum]